MKILITGAGGMLGSDLVSRLFAKHEVLGVGRKPAPHLPAAFRQADLSLPEAAEEIVRSFRPEVILHSAAMTDVDRCESHRGEALRGNLEVTRNLTDSANRAGSVLVFFSTDFVFDGKQPRPYTEEDAPKPLNVYGESKLLAERYVLAQANRFMILRTAWTFGCHGNNFPRKVLERAEHGKAVSVIENQVGNPTSTEDVAEAVSQILDWMVREGRSNENQIFHVTNRGNVTRVDFARQILKEKGFAENLVLPVPKSQVKRRAERPDNSTLSTEKLKQRFGIELRPWREALIDYLSEISVQGAGKKS